MEKKKKQNKDRVLVEGSRELGDNQIALFLYKSLAICAERQITGLPVKEQEDWSVPTRPSWKCENSTLLIPPKKMIEHKKKSSGLLAGAKINYRKKEFRHLRRQTLSHKRSNNPWQFN